MVETELFKLPSLLKLSRFHNDAPVVVADYSNGTAVAVLFFNLFSLKSTQARKMHVKSLLEKE